MLYFASEKYWQIHTHTKYLSCSFRRLKPKVFTNIHTDNITWCHSKPIFYRISHEGSKCVEKWLDLFLNTVLCTRFFFSYVCLGKTFVAVCVYFPMESQLVLFNTFSMGFQSLFFLLVFFSILLSIRWVRDERKSVFNILCSVWSRYVFVTSSKIILLVVDWW